MYYDVIVADGGSAGSVVAAKLAECAGWAEPERVMGNVQHL